MENIIIKNVVLEELPCKPISIKDGPYTGQKTLFFAKDDQKIVYDYLIRFPQYEFSWYQQAGNLSFVFEQ